MPQLRAAPSADRKCLPISQFSEGISGGWEDKLRHMQQVDDGITVNTEKAVRESSHEFCHGHSAIVITTYGMQTDPIAFTLYPNKFLKR
jgi:hypothetical protein